MHGTWKTEGGGGGAAGLIALAVVLCIAAAVLHAIWHTIVEAAEITALAVISALGLAAVAGIACVALRARRHVLGQRGRQPIPVRAEVIRLGAGPEVPEADRPALAAPHAASWPLPGWWADVRPHVGHDDERR